MEIITGWKNNVEIYEICRGDQEWIKKPDIKVRFLFL
jgi:hypothetical protein